VSRDMQGFRYWWRNKTNTIEQFTNWTFLWEISSTRLLQQSLVTKVPVGTKTFYVQAWNRPETFWQSWARLISLMRGRALDSLAPGYFVDLYFCESLTSRFLIQVQTSPLCSVIGNCIFQHQINYAEIISPILQ